MVVVCMHDDYRDEAEKLANRLQTTLAFESPEAEVFLQLDESGLSLRGNGQTVQGDFKKMLPRLRANNLNGEMLVKAARLKNADVPLTAVDATAGLGDDSLLLAAAGYEVTLFERDPVIAALLSDTIRRGLQNPDLCEIVSRMHLIEGDSISGMAALDFSPTVVLLDPMFPERQKSALVKKKFQLLHHLEKPCDEERELLVGAMALRPRKLIIKRPLKGPFLAGEKPHYSHNGKAIRYDCFVFAK